jgi:hypothetical protein
VEGGRRINYFPYSLAFKELQKYINLNKSGFDIIRELKEM